jgi:hypothetical protein
VGAIFGSPCSTHDYLLTNNFKLLYVVLTLWQIRCAYVLYQSLRKLPSASRPQHFHPGNPILNRAKRVLHQSILDLSKCSHGSECSLSSFRQLQRHLQHSSPILVQVSTIVNTTMAAPATEARLPRGVGRVPEWWMEITPHDTLYLQEDEDRRQHEWEEARMYEELAAKDDLVQKYGGEGFPDWDPAAHGPRTTEEEAEWVKTGYKRNEASGNWENESGEPLNGRQFQGKFPPGYKPGKYTGGRGGGGGPGFGQGQLSSGTRYGSDEGKQWKQPDWMKVKLRSTKNGDPKSPKKETPSSTEPAAAAPPPELATPDLQAAPAPALAPVDPASSAPPANEPSWVKQRREKEEAAEAEVAAPEPEPAQQRESEYFEEEIFEDEIIEEEYVEEEIVEEEIIEEEVR